MKDWMDRTLVIQRCQKTTFLLFARKKTLNFRYQKFLLGADLDVFYSVNCK